MTQNQGFHFGVVDLKRQFYEKRMQSEAFIDLQNSLYEGKKKKSVSYSTYNLP